MIDNYEIDVYSDSLVFGPAKKKLSNTTWGVFKAYVVSLSVMYIMSGHDLSL